MTLTFFSRGPICRNHNCLETLTGHFETLEVKYAPDRVVHKREEVVHMRAQRDEMLLQQLRNDLEEATRVNNQAINFEDEEEEKIVEPIVEVANNVPNGIKYQPRRNVEKWLICSQINENKME